MARYVVYRLLQTIPVLFGVSVVVFLLVRLIPGNPAIAILGSRATPELVARVNDELGLDLPLWQQYLNWLGNVLHGRVRHLVLLPGRRDPHHARARAHHPGAPHLLHADGPGHLRPAGHHRGAPARRRRGPGHPAAVHRDAGHPVLLAGHHPGARAGRAAAPVPHRGAGHRGPGHAVAPDAAGADHRAQHLAHPGALAAQQPHRGAGLRPRHDRQAPPAWPLRRCCGATPCATACCRSSRCWR